MADEILKTVYEEEGKVHRSYEEMVYVLREDDDIDQMDDEEFEELVSGKEIKDEEVKEEQKEEDKEVKEEIPEEDLFNDYEDDLYQYDYLIDERTGKQFKTPKYATHKDGSVPLTDIVRKIPKKMIQYSIEEFESQRRWLEEFKELFERYLVDEIGAIIDDCMISLQNRIDRGEIKVKEGREPLVDPDELMEELNIRKEGKENEEFYEEIKRINAAPHQFDTRANMLLNASIEAYRGERWADKSEELFLERREICMHYGYYIALFPYEKYHRWMEVCEKMDDVYAIKKFGLPSIEVNVGQFYDDGTHKFSGRTEFDFVDLESKRCFYEEFGVDYDSLNIPILDCVTEKEVFNSRVRFLRGVPGMKEANLDYMRTQGYLTPEERNYQKLMADPNLTDFERWLFQPITDPETIKMVEYFDSLEELSDEEFKKEISRNEKYKYYDDDIADVEYVNGALVLESLGDDIDFQDEDLIDNYPCNRKFSKDPKLRENEERMYQWFDEAVYANHPAPPEEFIKERNMYRIKGDPNAPSIFELHPDYWNMTEEEIDRMRKEKIRKINQEAEHHKKDLKAKKKANEMERKRQEELRKEKEFYDSLSPEEKAELNRIKEIEMKARIEREKEDAVIDAKNKILKLMYKKENLKRELDNLDMSKSKHRKKAKKINDDILDCDLNINRLKEKYKFEENEVKIDKGNPVKNFFGGIKKGIGDFFKGVKKKSKKIWKGFVEFVCDNSQVVATLAVAAVGVFKAFQSNANVASQNS